MREMSSQRVPVMTRPERNRLAFLTSTHVVDDLYQGAVPALLPFLAIERHYSYAGLTGITLAATFLASVVQPGFGALTDKYRNLGWLVAAGVLVAGLGIGVSGLGDNYLITWLAVAASGIGVAAYHPEATRTARGLAGDSTQAMSWFSVGGNAGIALGPVIVTPVLLATRLHGTPLLALPAVVMASVLAIRRPWRQVAGLRPRSAGRTRAAGGRDDDWRGFARLTVVVVLRSVAYFGVASLIALFAIRHFHSSAAVGSAALTVFIGSGVRTGHRLVRAVRRASHIGPGFPAEPDRRRQRRDPRLGGLGRRAGRTAIRSARGRLRPADSARHRRRLPRRCLRSHLRHR
jgi:MFS transporter, FSR family, fosmidomycin resistance protein